MSFKRYRKIVVAALLIGALLIGFGTGIVYSMVTAPRTPQTSDYVPAVSTPGWRTPPTSNYVPVVPTPGWRTPPMSDYVPVVPTPGWRTPPMSDYVP